ncbi:hypothetical protein BSBH6_02398 [Bacillus subtilis]|nr:hypothetical protein BSBH6_02398 [Bacillus subtilis]RPK24881.1 hypothetical protein BH5_01711 [Bacillus subtilis]
MIFSSASDSNLSAKRLMFYFTIDKSLVEICFQMILKKQSAMK